MDKVDEILGHGFPRDPQVVYLGLITEENVHRTDWFLFKVLTIAGRKAITRNWLECEPPGVKDWMTIVREIFSMEKMTAILRTRADIHDNRWRKWNSWLNLSGEGP